MPPDNPMSDREELAERVLWSSRLLMLLGVIGSLFMALIVVWVSVVDIAVVAAEAVGYASSTERSDDRAGIIVGVVKAVDGFLLAAVMVLVAFGLYELFVSRLDPARSAASRPAVLLVGSIDELKDQIAKLVILILVIEFFQRSLQAELHQSDDLLRLAGALSLVALALALPSLSRTVKRSAS